MPSRRGGIAIFSCSPRPAGALQPSADKPRPEETVEIFRAGEIPEAMCTALAGLVRGIVAEELSGKPYDKVRSRKVERFVELPAPTLHDLRRTKSHRVLSMIEEYHVKAEFDGQPEIQIARMPTLKGYRDSGVSLLMFSVKASVPAKGHVSYKIPGAVSVSTGFRAMAKLSLVGEVRTVKSGDRLSFSSPELREAHVELQGLRSLERPLECRPRADRRHREPRAAAQPRADPPAGQQVAGQGDEVPRVPQPAAAVSVMKDER